MNDYEQRQQIETARAEGDRRARHARWQAGETISELEGDLEQANEELDRLRRKVKLGKALAKASREWVRNHHKGRNSECSCIMCVPLRAFEDCDA